MAITNMATALKYKYPEAKICIKQLPDGSPLFTRWECVEHPAVPTSNEISEAISKYEIYETDEKDKRKNRKKDVLQKLGLNTNDIKSLVELIQDQNDD